jgi:ATP-binding cassette subfamily F protein uup
LQESGQEDEKPALAIPEVAASPAKKKKGGKLSYLDQREYDQIEEKILEAEEEQERLQALMDDPETVSDPARLHECWEELQAAQATVAQLYDRWHELEEKKNGGE